LSLYYDFRQMTPAGAQGDEMIRNLARRLVKVDLLDQAADLLEYQIDSRLQGAAQAQVAADLALIRIADRNPEGALRALNRTRMANLAPTLERQRRILEARALIDADREDLALDLLARIEGRDADLLRVDGYWSARNYMAASDLIETIYASQSEPLTQQARMHVIKAAVGLVLADDTLGLSRLRTKFSERMAQSAEWPLFEYITSPDASPTGVEFKAAAKLVANMDSITAFLGAYREIYKADADITPDEAARRTEV
jgi:outer membrane PBP1 activator LpoA protein